MRVQCLLIGVVLLAICGTLAAQQLPNRAELTKPYPYMLGFHMTGY